MTLSEITQAKAGISLPDQYAVKRGELSRLDLKEPIRRVHDMSQVLTSERLSGSVIRGVSGAVAQSSTFSITLSAADVGIPATPCMVRAFGVIVDTASSVLNATFSILELETDRDVPVWTWDSTIDEEITARFSEGGSGNSNHVYLRSIRPNFLPLMTLGSLQPNRLGGLALKGTTTAFGAGNVNLTLFATLVFAGVEGISSQGCPVPSW